MKFVLKQIYKMLMQYIVFPFVYFKNRLSKVDDRLVIFADSHHDSCPSYMLSLREKLKSEHYNIKEFYINSSKHTKKEVTDSMLDFMRVYPTASFVVICDYYLPVSSCRKKKETKVIQLWHGCGAFKRFGHDASDDIPKFYIGSPIKNYNLVTVSGDGCLTYFRSAMQIPDFENNIVRPIGAAYTDKFYDEDFIESCRDKFRFAYPNARGKKVILWAPTFRGNAGRINEKKDVRLFENMRLDINSAVRELPDTFLIESLHPHMNVGSDSIMTTEELMVCADMLITDYSSVFFELLLMDKPILFYVPDLEKYTEKRGFYLNFNKLPGRIVRDKKNLKYNIKESLYNDDMSEQREEFKIKYMNGCDGKVTKKIMDYIEGQI
ncbi:MAG: CDP-glycerol glycerophosphotransferase family protein [Lachnospiraceae bacterium]|nr:CDP-glycerol glycerophosphotransferase family protein [Lachnospiraceae bacterium]